MRKTSRKVNITARKIIPVIFIAVFMIALYSFSVLNLLLPKPTVSTSENRVLEQKPEFSLSALLDGSYTENYERYYSDTFPMRDQLAGIASRLETLKGMRGDDDLVIYDGTNDNIGVGDDVDDGGKAEAIYNGYYHRHATLDSISMNKASRRLVPLEKDTADTPDTPDTPDEPDEPTPDEPVEPETPPEDEGGYVQNVDGNGKTFVIGNTALELVGENDAAGKKYASVINGFRAKLPESVKIYNLVIPKHSEFYPFSSKYQHLSGNQKASIEKIYSQLASGVIGVDAYSALEAHKNEYIYFRSDHHWTQRGAYYAYGKFAEAAGFTQLPETSYTKRTIEGFLGTLYSSTQDARLAATPDYVEMYKPTGKYDVTCYRKSGETYKGSLMYNKASSIANSYGVFLGGDIPLMKVVNTASQSGRILVMVKESYGNCFATFMPDHFDTVYIVDQRYYKNLVLNGAMPNLTEFVLEVGATDLLFINNIHAAIGYTRINELEALLNGF